MKSDFNNFHFKETEDTPYVLKHWGIHGQKWGKRRYQNEDGSLTPEGREHYGYGEAREKSREEKVEAKRNKKQIRENYVNKYKSLKKDTTQMTDDELQSETRRLLLENNYNKQLSEYKGTKIANESIEKKSFVKKKAIQSGFEIAAGIATGVIGNKIVDSIGGSPVLKVPVLVAATGSAVKGFADFGAAIAEKFGGVKVDTKNIKQTSDMWSDINSREMNVDKMRDNRSEALKNGDTERANKLTEQIKEAEKTNNEYYKEKYGV